MLTNEQLDELHEIIDWCQSAAMDMSIYDDRSAEEIYNDPNIMSDLIGDRLSDIPWLRVHTEWNEAVDLLCKYVCVTGLKELLRR